MGTDLIPLSVEHEGATWPLWMQPQGGAPLAKDLDVAAWLGYEVPRNIRKIIDRYSDELGISLHDGAKFVSDEKRGRGRRESGYLLTEAQALFIAAKSDTPKATQVLKAMIAVFLRARDMLAGRVLPQLDAREHLSRQLTDLDECADARHAEMGEALRLAFERVEERGEERARDLLMRVHELPALIRADIEAAIRASEDRIVARLAQVMPMTSAPPKGPARVNTAGAAAILGVRPNSLRVRMRRGDDALRACVVGSAGTRDLFDVARLRAYISARGRGR